MWRAPRTWLTVTKVVFEYNPAIDVELPKIRLTVTKVVFEWFYTNTAGGYMWGRINSNKSCFWMMIPNLEASPMAD